MPPLRFVIAAFTLLAALPASAQAQAAPDLCRLAPVDGAITLGPGSNPWITALSDDSIALAFPQGTSSASQITFTKTSPGGKCATATVPIPDPADNAQSPRVVEDPITKQPIVFFRLDFPTNSARQGLWAWRGTGQPLPVMPPAQPGFESSYWKFTGYNDGMPGMGLTPDGTTWMLVSTSNLPAFAVDKDFKATMKDPIMLNDTIASRLRVGTTVDGQGTPFFAFEGGGEPMVHAGAVPGADHETSLTPSPNGTFVPGVFGMAPAPVGVATIAAVTQKYPSGSYPYLLARQVKPDGTGNKALIPVAPAASAGGLSLTASPVARKFIAAWVDNEGVLVLQSLSDVVSAENLRLVVSQPKDPARQLTRSPVAAVRSDGTGYVIGGDQLRRLVVIPIAGFTQAPRPAKGGVVSGPASYSFSSRTGRAARVAAAAAAKKPCVPVTIKSAVAAGASIRVLAGKRTIGKAAPKLKKGTSRSCVRFRGGSRSVTMSVATAVGTSVYPVATKKLRLKR